ncbi:MAG: xylulose kinase [Actinobacteria bacterium]|nr:xylulose kinase [Actinomycetota bacterium]
MSVEVTVGIDIGTTSVKAVAADGDGTVLARARVPHDLRVPGPDLLEHDANQAWRRGVRRALRLVARDLDVKGVNVGAMVPSLAAVDRRGMALTPGLLYGDARGLADRTFEGPGNAGEVLGFLRWCAEEAPEATGYWPAQAVANRALAGRGVLDSVSAMAAFPLFNGAEWDEEMCGGAGVDPARMPEVVPGNVPVGRLADLGGAVLGPGVIDAFGEQLVAGADEEGDVLVILGATLITWAVTSEWREVSGIWTIPHTAPGKVLIGGPSNSGGLFLDWARRLIGRGPDEPVAPERVPVFLPYIRGERTPLHDPHRRGALHDLDLTHSRSALLRAAYEAGGFVVRHHLDLAGVSARRIVATGGGTRAPGWLQALADCTGLPVDPVAVAEGGALGAAFLARVAAGLEPDANGSARWARSAERVEPDRAWEAACRGRYERFRELTGPTGTG